MTTRQCEGIGRGLEGKRGSQRWTRTGPKTLAYEVLIEDPTVWTRPWTIKQEFARQSDEENRIYCEPRCIEGNFGLPGCCTGGAWRSARSPRDAALTREPRTTSAGCSRFGTIRCSSAPNA